VITPGLQIAVPGAELGQLTPPQTGLDLGLHQQPHRVALQCGVGAGRILPALKGRRGREGGTAAAGPDLLEVLHAMEKIKDLYEAYQDRRDA
jgi:hypothetical protein